MDLTNPSKYEDLTDIQASTWSLLSCDDNAYFGNTVTCDADLEDSNWASATPSGNCDQTPMAQTYERLHARFAFYMAISDGDKATSARKMLLVDSGAVQEGTGDTGLEDHVLWEMATLYHHTAPGTDKWKVTGAIQSMLKHVVDSYDPDSAISVAYKEMAGHMTDSSRKRRRGKGMQSCLPTCTNTYPTPFPRPVERFPPTDEGTPLPGHISPTHAPPCVSTPETPLLNHTNSHATTPHAIHRYDHCVVTHDTTHASPPRTLQHCAHPAHAIPCVPHDYYSPYPLYLRDPTPCGTLPSYSPEMKAALYTGLFHWTSLPTHTMGPPSPRDSPEADNASLHSLRPPLHAGVHPLQLLPPPLVSASHKPDLPPDHAKRPPPPLI